MGWAKKLMIEQELADMMTMHPFEGDKYVCPDHFSDIYLKQFIEQNGQSGVCSYCGKSQEPVLEMSQFTEMIVNKLSDRLDSLDNANLPLWSSYFGGEDDNVPGLRQFGCYTITLGAEQYETTKELLYNYDLYTGNEKLDDDIESCFNHDEWVLNDVFREDLDTELSREWNYFVEMVKHKKRYTFFSDSLFHKEEPWQDDIISRIMCLCTTILLDTIEPGTVLFRGRPNDSKNPYTSFNDLTSPPNYAAKENRMSACGISMFYGAFEIETAIGEIRHYNKEGCINIGEFETKTILQIINLTKMPNCLSFWMPQYYEEYKFLKIFHSEITKAVDINEDKPVLLDYIPTQIFTEYIRHMSCKKIDGILYKSSINTSGRNLVLFYDNNESSSILNLNKTHIV